ncbi:ead/Ea22-like family protein [Paenibacillus macerans]|uniref:hypothetical protein n=1 Tax=Paenibacillus macerans TaxID=44252 RepID=UPI002DBA32A8|nr:hypothetical protein [Paenibacillus macerans]MEC0140460.1 ead/Ea22-like family protein [Paenibacillus macerans]
MSSNDRIQEIRERLEAATSGTWDSCGDAVMAQDGSWVCQMYEGDENDDAPTREFQNATNNSEFIACAPDDIAYLLSEVERLQKENKVMKEALEWTRKRFEEEWTYEPGIGEVVDEIIGRFTQ